MQEQYLKAFSEVEQIIELMPEGLQNKIPEKFKNILSTWKDKSYVPNIQEPSVTVLVFVTVAVNH